MSDKPDYLIVQCPMCYAAVGERCYRTIAPLKHVPPHAGRKKEWRRIDYAARREAYDKSMNPHHPKDQP